MEDVARFGRLTHQIIGACIEVHRLLGPGLLESAYQACLAHELALRGVEFEARRSIPLVFKNLRLPRAYEADFVVAGQVVVELKVVSELKPVHREQLRTYLRLAGLTTGLLINFDVPTLKDGIRRVSLLPASSPPG